MKEYVITVGVIKMIIGNEIIAFAVYNVEINSIMYGSDRPAIYNNIGQAKAYLTTHKNKNLRIIELRGVINDS